MTDQRGSSRCCPGCILNLTRDWLDARLFMLYGETPKQKEEKLYEYLCPLCDQPVGVDLACEDCGVYGTRRLKEVTDDEEEDDDDLD